MNIQLYEADCPYPWMYTATVCADVLISCFPGEYAWVELLRTCLTIFSWWEHLCAPGAVNMYYFMWIFCVRHILSFFNLFIRSIICVHFIYSQSNKSVQVSPRYKPLGLSVWAPLLLSWVSPMSLSLTLSQMSVSMTRAYLVLSKQTTDRCGHPNRSPPTNVPLGTMGTISPFRTSPEERYKRSKRPQPDVWASFWGVHPYLGGVPLRNTKTSPPLPRKRPPPPPRPAPSLSYG